MAKTKTSQKGLPRVSPREPVKTSEDGTAVGVPLPHGKVAWVDVADWPSVAGYNWCTQTTPRGAYAWYAVRYRRPGDDVPGSGPVRMHTQITGWPLVDHIDGDGLNNRRSNLRPATPGANRANARKRVDCTSQFKGVHWSGAGRKWAVSVRGRHLGLFSDEIEAARTYDAAARETFGEFARLNFPEER